jgi:hypothetical protein
MLGDGGGIRRAGQLLDLGGIGQPGISTLQ